MLLNPDLTGAWELLAAPELNCFSLMVDIPPDTIMEVLIQHNLQHTKGDFACTRLLFLA